jgi:hypothetical protein
VTWAPVDATLGVGCDVEKCVYYHGREEPVAEGKTSLSNLLIKLLTKL